MTKKDAILSVKHLFKTYQSAGNEAGITALNNVTFDLYEGELLAIMGTSGSGKSTLLNILGALDEPDEGKIKLRGKPMDDIFSEPNATNYRRDHISFIFQSFHLLNDLTVEENVALPLIIKNIDNHEIEERVGHILEIVGLSKWKAHKPVQLSGGQQQRVAIGRALVVSPPIILADELTGNLDFNTTTDILHTLVQLKDKLNQSMIMVTHDPYVATFADRVFFFHDGEIVDDYERTHEEDGMNVILQKFRAIMERSI